jgi:hypothetical protein
MQKVKNTKEQYQRLGRLFPATGETLLDSTLLLF